MRDVASVQDSAQIQSNIVRINGRRQVYIPIYRQPGANTIESVDAIRSKLSEAISLLNYNAAQVRLLATLGLLSHEAIP